MSDEKRYLVTEQQALKLGLREVCKREGHQLEPYEILVQLGERVWKCMRCDVRVGFTYPDLGLTEAAE